MVEIIDKFHEPAVGSPRPDRSDPLDDWLARQIRLKGIHASHKRLADETAPVYHCAWRGGPRLKGEPGSTEFLASDDAAIATRLTLPSGRLVSVPTRYQLSDDYPTSCRSHKAGLLQKRRDDREEVLPSCHVV